MLNTDFSKFDDAKRALAKLMAMENITVQFISGLSTASFDMLARVMSIPAEWLSVLTVDQIDLLIGHEVGHALHTDTIYIKAVTDSLKLKKHPGLMSYINVVEDGRIERKQREAYPGLKASFYNGYREFTTTGPIFRIKGTKVDGRAVADMSLIDRINVFYKLGAFIKVPFAADELHWMEKIDKAWSTERAVEIAKELHELAKDEIEQQQQEQKDKQKNQPKGQSGESGESGEPGEPGEESEGDDKKPSKGKSKDKKDGKDADGDGESGDDKDKADDKKSGKGDGDDDASDGDDDSEADAGDGSDASDGGDTDKPAKPTKRGGKGDGDDDANDGDDDSEADAGDGSDGGGRDDADKPAKPTKRSDLDPASETDKALADALKKLVDAQAKPKTQQIRHLLLKPLDDATVKARTITAATWSDSAMKSLSRVPFAMDRIKKIEDRWNDKYLSTAENMAQEFTRKKMAKNLTHARVGKSGRLDMTKLAKYKFADDLFKRVTVVPDGQSHGIVMIIDGSSSMSGVFGAVLDQVLLFAHFTFKVNIPFECYMFTNQCDHYSVQSMGLQTIALSATGSLVGLVNTVTDRASFKKQVQAVLAFRTQFVNDGPVPGNTAHIPHVPYSGLGMTPLFSGMMIAERHIERMKRTLRLDKVMAVVISDGDDNGGLVYETQDVDADGDIQHRYSNVCETGIVVRDTVTKQNHVLVDTRSDVVHGKTVDTYCAPDNAIMTLFFDVLKARHGCRSIYIYLTEGGDGTRNFAPHQACHSLAKACVKFRVHVDDVRKSMAVSNQFVMPADQSVADCALVVRPAALQLSENEFAAWEAKGATQNYVAAAYVMASTKAVANRVFVNSVMPTLI